MKSAVIGVETQRGASGTPPGGPWASVLAPLDGVREGELLGQPGLGGTGLEALVEPLVSDGPAGPGTSGDRTAHRKRRDGNRDTQWPGRLSVSLSPWGALGASIALPI